MKSVRRLNGLARQCAREQDFTNVEAGPDGDALGVHGGQRRPGDAAGRNVNLAIGDFLTTPDGLRLPPALLREVKASIASLEHLPTARLERLIAEHIDLCSYRLDAWQTGLFARTVSPDCARCSPEGRARACTSARTAGSRTCARRRRAAGSPRRRSPSRCAKTA